MHDAHAIRASSAFGQSEVRLLGKADESWRLLVKAEEVEALGQSCCERKLLVRIHGSGSFWSKLMGLKAFVQSKGAKNAAIRCNHMLYRVVLKAGRQEQPDAETRERPCARQLASRGHRLTDSLD